MKLKKYIILIITLITFIFPVNAGVVSKSAKIGASYAFIKFAIPAIKRGVGKKVTGLALQKLKSKSFTEFTEVMAILTFAAVVHYEYKDNILNIMNFAGVLTDDLILKIDENSKEFLKIENILTIEADKIDKQYKKKSCDTYKLLMTSQGYPSDMRFVNNPVRQWDVAAYYVLDNNSVRNDLLEHDHIPSKESIKNFLRKKGYKISGSVEDDVDYNSTAIEVSRELHFKGATFGGKQNQIINGVKKKFFDSDNLRIVTIRDMSYHYINSRDSQVIKSFFPLYKRNLDLCLYN